MTMGERTSAESLPKRSARPKRGKKAVTKPDAEAVTVTPKAPQLHKFQGWVKILKMLAAATSLNHMRQLAVGMLGATPEIPSTEDQLNVHLDWDNMDKLVRALLPIASQSVHDDYIPIYTTGNGDCLFNALSRITYGHEGRSIEMRACCILEAVLNSAHYQDPKYMAIGANNTAWDLLEFIMEYSVYKGNEYSGPQGITRAWESEVAKMARKGQDASMWALSIAANMLHCHWLFVPFPAENHTRTPAIIMWTQSHSASPSYDHFVPVVK